VLFNVGHMGRVFGKGVLFVLTYFKAVSEKLSMYNSKAYFIWN
jgi:hypothetical protein